MIYRFKPEKSGMKDFKDYQNPTELFKSLMDANPKEVLKNKK